MSKTQVQHTTTAQGEVLLAKYLTDSIRSIEQVIRKAAPGGAPGATLSRSLSAPRQDPRAGGRRAATEVLLPRKLPATYAPAAAAAAAAHATRRAEDLSSLGYGHERSRTAAATVAATQARLLHSTGPAGAAAAAAGGGGGPSSGAAALRPSGSSGAALPPRPAGVIRTAHAAHQSPPQQPHQQSQHQYYTTAPFRPGAPRSASAPRGEDAGAASPHHRTHPSADREPPHHTPHKPEPLRLPQGPTGAAAPSPAAAPPPPALSPGGLSRVGGGLSGLTGGGGDARSVASMRLAGAALSEAGSHTSWWRWRPVTDASYPLTAITERYAQSMTPSELVKWNDKVARLEAQIAAEKEARVRYEQQLKKLQGGAGSGGEAAAGPGGSSANVGRGGGGSKPAAPSPFR